MSTLLDLNFWTSSAASWAIGAVCAAVLFGGVKAIRLFRFRLAFGPGLRDTKGAGIVISALYAAPGAAGDIQLRKKPRSQPVRFIDGADEFRLAADGDLVCAAEITSLFAERMGGTIALNYDDEDFDKLDRTLILIGAPISNTLASYYRDRAKVSGGLCFDIVATTNRAEEQYVVDHLTGQTYALDDAVEYAIIQRVPAYDGKSGGKYVFFVGGLTKFGTEAAGRYLRVHWRQFVRPFQGDKCIGILLEVARRDARTVRPLVRHIGGPTFIAPRFNAAPKSRVTVGPAQAQVQRGVGRTLGHMANSDRGSFLQNAAGALSPDEDKSGDMT